MNIFLIILYINLLNIALNMWILYVIILILLFGSNLQNVQFNYLFMLLLSLVWGRANI